MKHIKENNLYQKKTKTKTGGSARFSFTDEAVNATVRSAIIPEARKTGNVKSLKYMKRPETLVKPRRTKTMLAIEDQNKKTKQLTLERKTETNLKNKK